VTRYPSPAAAAEAARTGTPVSVKMGDSVDLWWRWDQSGRFTVTVPAGYTTHDALKLAAAVSPEQHDQAAGMVRAVLTHLASQVEVPLVPTVERHGSGYLAGWSLTVSIERAKDWDEVDAAITAAGFYEAMDKIVGTDEWPMSTAVTHDLVPQLAAAGVPIALCERCGDPITNRHPRWPGVWIGLSENETAHCPGAHRLDVGAADNLDHDLSGYVTCTIELPHQPAS